MEMTIYLCIYAFWEETWHDQQKDNDDNNDNDNIEDNEAMMTMTLREHPERMIQEICDFCDTESVMSLDLICDMCKPL